MVGARLAVAPETAIGIISDCHFSQVRALCAVPWARFLTTPPLSFIVLTYRCEKLTLSQAPVRSAFAVSRLLAI